MPAEPAAEAPAEPTAGEAAPVAAAEPAPAEPLPAEGARRRRAGGPGAPLRRSRCGRSAARARSAARRSWSSTRAGHTVLLDAGQRVKGEYGLDTASPFHYSLPGRRRRCDAIVISHAHIDHIGSLPLLHSEFQRHREDPMPVLMSEPTRRVGEIMLLDSAKIQHKRQYLTSGAMAELAQSDFAPQLDLKPAYDKPEIQALLDDECCGSSNRASRS